MAAEEKEAVRNKLKDLLNSSIVACGSEGTNLKKFCQMFKEDWSENLVDYAHRLGYSSGNQNKDILDLIKSYPKECSIIELSAGEALLKPIGSEETKENLKLIDKTKKEIAKERAIKEQRNRSLQPNPNLVPVQNSFPLRNLPGPPPPIRFAHPPPFPAIPMANRIAHPPGYPIGPPIRPSSTPQQSTPTPPLQQPSIPPPLPGGKKNANLEPLGQRRPSSRIQKSGPAWAAATRYLQSNSKQNGHHAPSPPHLIINGRSTVNDFGDILPQKKNKIKVNIQQQASTSNVGLAQQKNGHRHNVDSKNWEEDFRATPSNGASGIGSLVDSRERIDIWQECDDDNGIVQNEMNEEEDDEYEEEEQYWECESEWEFDVGMDMEWEEDGEECAAFIDGNERQWPPIPSDLYRLIHLFRLNGGIYSSAKIEALQKAYNEAFNAALTSKEWNRLLGNEELIKIFKDRFKKWPASKMFNIVEKTSSYNIELLRNLTDALIDPSIFFFQNVVIPSAKPSTPIRAQPSPMVTGNQRHNSQSPAILTENKLPTPSMPSPAPSNGGQEPSNSHDLEQFSALAIFTQELLFKAKNGPRKPLIDLFDRIKALARPDQFSTVLLASKAAFLGYLRLFNESFRVEFQGDGIYIIGMKFHPNSESFSIPPNSFKFVGQFDFHKGDRHKVTMIDYKSGIHAVLQLSQVFCTLREFLGEYQQILEDGGEPSAQNCVQGQRIFFLDGVNNLLCRGQFLRADGNEMAVIRDIDTGRERYIPRKDIFEIPHNFPSWRFPSCHFFAQFVGVNETKLKEMWNQKNCEFTVDIADVDTMPKFCRVRLAEN